ncbi:hypothetical protein DY000_02048587 [Brassica cretica]|uniref:Uncharacterized protein n=1 Tax=Brassica cretica TaxID=69181 RepID=A0ABQ7EPL8_BRACR|nr:hypothetical protein DY000_02048587 [Brassica cretica]
MTKRKFFRSEISDMQDLLLSDKSSRLSPLSGCSDVGSDAGGVLFLPPPWFCFRLLLFLSSFGRYTWSSDLLPASHHGEASPLVEFVSRLEVRSPACFKERWRVSSSRGLFFPDLGFTGINSFDPFWRSGVVARGFSARLVSRGGSSPRRHPRSFRSAEAASRLWLRPITGSVASSLIPQVTASQLALGLCLRDVSSPSVRCLLSLGSLSLVFESFRMGFEAGSPLGLSHLDALVDVFLTVSLQISFQLIVILRCNLSGLHGGNGSFGEEEAETCSPAPINRN